MSVSWPSVELGQVVKHRKEFIEIDDLTTYVRPRVRLHAQGVVQRDRVLGAEIKTKKQQVCRAGEFLVAEIDAKVGGFGIVPQELDGALVSSHYFLFQVDSAKLDGRFLDFYARTRAFREQVEAQGSTNYAAIRPGDVLNYKIPLPPLPEQRRIVERIEAVAERFDEAIRLREAAAEGIRGLLTSVRRHFFGDEIRADWVPLASYVAHVEAGKSPATLGRPATISEWGVLKVGAVSFGRFDDCQQKALPPSYVPSAHLEVRSGDFIVSRANTAELVGSCAVVGATRPRLMLSDKTFRLHLKEPDAVDSLWLEQVLRAPVVRRQIEARATGTSSTMKNISQEKLLNILVPRMRVVEQRSFVNWLRGIERYVTEAHEASAAAQVSLSALLPAMLNRTLCGDKTEAVAR